MKYVLFVIYYNDRVIGFRPYFKFTSLEVYELAAKKDPKTWNDGQNSLQQKSIILNF
jgi:hypothetical protein